MPTVNINDTVHLRDNWNRIVTPATGFSVSIDDTVHLRDDLTRDLEGITLQTKYINDTVHLRDSHTRYVPPATGLVEYLTETVHLRDSHTRDVSVSGVYRYLYETVHLREEITKVEVKANMVFLYNKNISFGETKEPGFKEYSHRFRWTNYNGVAVPDMNYKDLKEPIVRMMPAPSFLQFEYANSFLLFTRNSINRFILTPDVETGQWRARTDNLIEEFKDLGLMSPKTLILAGDTLFGQSEKGVWKWNKKGMKLISDKIIALPDAGAFEYIAFYSSIRNQYILHRQESGGSIYQMTHGTKAMLPNTGVGLLYHPAVVMITDTKFVAFYYEDNAKGYIVVGEISGDAITYGTPVIEYPSNNSVLNLIRMSDTKVLMTYDQAAGARKMAVGTISGNTITKSGVVSLTSGVYHCGFLERFSDTRFVIFHGNNGYYTGTFDGNETITLDDHQLNWTSSHALQNMKTYPISEGKVFIMYALYMWPATGNVLCRVIEDNGDGTVNFGPVLDTGILYNVGKDEWSVVMPSDDTFFTVIANDRDLILLPLSLSGTTLTAGDKTTKTNWFDTLNDVNAVAIANKGTSGFWLIFSDDRNSGYTTVMWGTGSSIKMYLWEDSFEVIDTTESRRVKAIRIPGGRALLLHGEGIAATSYGYATVWGMHTAAIDSWVYQIDRDKWWGKFLGMDILDIPVILSGGSLDENYNLWLDNDRQLMKYPGTAYTAVKAVIRTKEFYIQKGLFQRYLVDFEGSDVDVETRVKRVVDGSEVEIEDIKYNVTPNEMRLIALAKSGGRSMSIKIYNADVISALLFDIKEWGER